MLLLDLNRKMFLYQPKFLANCYEKIMNCGNAYPYMIIDKTVDCDSRRCVRTGLFDDEYKFIYEPA